MRRVINIVALAAVVVLASACGVNTDKNRVGTPIGKVVNGIPASAAELSKYCTAYNPDPSLHAHTIKELVEASTPFILIFGTPSHCTQCQNQIDTVKHYKDQYDGAFEVIHIDQYKNSHIYTELRVNGDPWTFLIDGKGIIQAIYPGVTTWDDLSEPIRRMLGEAPEKTA